MERENRKKSFGDSHRKIHPSREAFVCKVCGRTVPPEGAGSEYRNHCPYCLSSLHLDTVPGDRAAGCGGTPER